MSSIRPRTRSHVLCTAVLALTAAAQDASDRERVVVRPVEIHDVLANPGMGITTFQRFNGDPLNPRLGWSEEGPTAKIPAAQAPPDFPDTSIAYCRWFWDVIEPAPGTFRWDIIDDAVSEARSHHQKLALRLMPYDPKHPLPAWYRNVDISSVGYWGEGWSPYMPPFPYQKALIDIWLDAFKRTPLLMNFDEQQALSYGTEHGAGWRLDCLGDMRLTSDNKDFKAEMLTVYPQQVVRAGIQDVWQRSPVSLESCWVPDHWLKQGWDVDYILDQALRWHVSSVNIKSSAIPSQWKATFDEFQKKMGYRFILRRLEYPRSARAGAVTPIHMWWLNAGVAPVYQEYWLALRVKAEDGSGDAVIRIPVDTRKWLPGDAVFDGTVYVPESLKAGFYTLEAGMLDPLTWPAGPPAIRFAIEGRQSDGWYRLGAITIR